MLICMSKKIVWLVWWQEEEKDKFQDTFIKLLKKLSFKWVVFTMNWSLIVFLKEGLQIYNAIQIKCHYQFYIQVSKKLGSILMYDDRTDRIVGMLGSVEETTRKNQIQIIPVIAKVGSMRTINNCRLFKIWYQYIEKYTRANNGVNV